MINHLEDLDVQFFRLRRVKWHAKGHEGVGQPLNPNADGTMAEVRSAGFGDGVIIHVDDAVEVVRDSFGDRVELVEVVFAVGNICGKDERGEVADGGLIRGRVLDDLSAEVG